MPQTFMQAIYEGAARAAESDEGTKDLKGISKQQVLATVKVLATGLDSLPPETSLHAVLYALTYMRNAVIAAMQVNQNRLEAETGGRG